MVYSGIALVDKPQGFTSHDVVARMRRIMGTRKVGHAGTLDPMATGLLLIGVNNATRLLHYLVGLDKEYLATIRLGWATATDDAEGERLPDGIFSLSTSGSVSDSKASPIEITDPEIRSRMAQLTGHITQVPSSVSAIKVAGKRSYARVRAGERVQLPGRSVLVSRFDLVAKCAAENGQAIDLDVRVVCSSGTYVRALARDLGAALKTGGHLTALRRTRIGSFSVAEAAPIGGVTPGGREAEPKLLSAVAAASRALPVVQVSREQASDLRYGKRLPATEVGNIVTDHVVANGFIRDSEYAGGSPKGDYIAAIGPSGENLIAIIERLDDRYRVVTGFPPEVEHD